MRAELNGQALDIYETLVFPAPYLKQDICRFVNIREKGILKIECDFTPESVMIRPKRLGLSAEIVGNVIEIEVDGACSFSVEPDGSTDDAVLVFAGGGKKTDFDGYDNVIRYEKGRHFIDVLTVNSDNTLLFLEDGAYLDGKVVFENCKNVAVCGGIISMEKFFRRGNRHNCVQFKNCTDVRVSDLTVLDSSNWSLQIMGCDNVEIDNYHAIGQRGNSDGLDVCGSRNVYARNCFTRVWDDSLVVKAFDTGGVENVVFEDCVLWNDFARPIEVGVELRADRVHDVHFRNIDIIHSPTGYPVLGIHHGDRAEVYDISYENINIEDTPGAQIFDIRITDSVWNCDAVKGDIHDILFKNIYAEKGDIALSPPRIHGFDKKSSVRNVTMENIRINGMAVRNSDELQLLTNEFTENIVYAEPEPPYITTVKTNIEISGLEFENGFYRADVVLTAENLSDTRVKGSARTEVLPSGRATEAVGKLEFDLMPMQKQSTEYKIILPPGKFVVCVQSPEAFVKCDWKFMALDMVLGEDINSAPKYEFTNCRGEHMGSAAFALKDDLLVLKSDILKEKGIVLYTAKPVPTENGQVMFSCEETDSANAPAVTMGKDEPELAPQLRCPAEITHVFKNEPKTEIVRTELTRTLSGESIVALESLGIDNDADSFWLEAEVDADVEKRYPVCMFSSQVPDKICHMFAVVRRAK